MTIRRLSFALSLSLGSSSALFAGCQEAPEKASAPAAASAGATSAADPGAAGQPSLAEVAELARQQQAEAVAKAINPTGLPRYSGPVGGVHGRVVIAGDPAPVQPEQSAQLPVQGCPRAQQLYTKLFRQGPDGSLADALVTVTEYKGFLAPAGEAVRVRAEGCAWSSRTIAMTFGQRLEVENLDSQPYIPSLLGAPTPALRIVMPRGPTVPLFFPRPGRFALLETTRDYMRADVFVLPFPAAKVTELDGRFAFDSLPVGDARVTAYLPAIGKTVDQRIVIEAGKSLDLTLTLTYSQAEQDTKTAAEQAARAAAGQGGSAATP
jgi:hypothetical protein